MQRSVLLLFSFCLLFAPLLAQRTVGLLRHQPERAWPGYNLFFSHNQSTVYLMDNCGQVVHRWTDSPDFRPGNAVYLLENGDLVKTKRGAVPVNDPIWAGGGGETVEVRDWSNTLKHSFSLNDSTARLHHDVTPMANGNILMIAWEHFSGTEAIAAGRDPAKLDRDELWSEMILEWDPVNDTIVWEWHVWDHLVQDFSPTAPDFDDPAARPERIDLNYDTHDGHPDWLHINGIDYNEALDQIVLSVPYFDELWVIDHSTTTEEARGSSGGNSGKGGDLLYRWGNPAAYGMAAYEDRQFFFQHDVHWIDPFAAPGEPGFGKMAIFNNRVDLNVSTGLILNTGYQSGAGYPIEEGIFGPQAPDLVLRHPDTSEIRSASSGLSSFQPLPNGNYLFLSGRWGYAYELDTASNELVWEYIVPLRSGSPVASGDTLGISENLTFRMTRYGENYPAFAGKNLISQGPIESGTPEGFCGLLTSVEERGISEGELRAYPNPVADVLTLDLPPTYRGKARLFNALGAMVGEWRVRDGHAQLQVGQFPAGAYLLRVANQQVRVLIQ